jgi:dihydrofolate reductase/thymidylate synthase
MKLNLIVAFCKNFGIGQQNKIPWHICEDLQHFQELTRGHTVVMGRETYFSIPEKYRPLKDRVNFVLTSNPGIYVADQTENVSFLNFDGLQEAWLNKGDHSVFVMGGEAIYKLFSNLPFNRLYVTYIDKDYECDRHFIFPKNCQLLSVSENYYSETEKCNYRFLEYGYNDTEHGEHQYLNLLQDILRNGNSRDDRTKTGTISVFGRQIRFDITQSIPVLTTKFVPFKMVVKELLWFLKGQTDNKILQDQGVHIWDGNTTREFLDQRGLPDYQVGDVGPMYGWQLRHFGAKYEGCTKDYAGQGIDQLEIVIDLLKKDPFSRRIAMTTYNVSDLEKGVLHPCHGIYVQFYVEVVNGQKYLSCHMTQRSVDCGCGLPFNIASYAVLTHIIAQKVDMLPKEVIISTGDTHIYNNHISALTTQVARTPYPFPQLRMKNIKNKQWEELTVDDFELVGYFYHPSIKLIMNV